MRALSLLTLLVVMFFSASSLLSHRSYAADSLIWASNPGAITTVSAAGVNYLVQQTMPLIIQQVQNLQIPDQHGSAHTPVGNVEYDVTEIRMQELKIGSVTVAMVAPSLLKLTISGLTVRGHFKWHYNAHIVRDSGSGDMDTAGTDVGFTVTLGMANGHPTVKTTEGHVALNNWNIHLSGGASWLYNLIIQLFHGTLTRIAQDQIRDGISQAIDKQGAKALATLSLQRKLDSYCSVDFTLPEAPIISNGFLGMPMTATFIVNANHTQIPTQPGPIPSKYGDKALQVFLSDWVAGSAAWAYSTSGDLTISVTQDKLPPKFPFKLDTASLKYIIPTLYDKYPNVPVEFVFAPDMDALANIKSHPGELNVTATYDVICRVWLDQTKRDTAFAIAAALNLGGLLNIKGNVLFPALQFGYFTMTTKSTNIGPLHLELMNDLIRDLLADVVIPIINAKLALGLALPSLDGLNWVNPAVQFAEGYVAVETDITYHPTGSSNSDVGESSHRVRSVPFLRGNN